MTFRSHYYSSYNYNSKFLLNKSVEFNRLKEQNENEEGTNCSNDGKNGLDEWGRHCYDVGVGTDSIFTGLE